MSTETQRSEIFTWSQVEEMAREVHISDEILQLAQIRLQSLCNLAAQSAQSAQSSELAALKADIAEHVRIAAEQATEIEALKAENEALRKDAGRYRWLRHGDNDDLVIQRGPVSQDFVYLPRNKKLDDMIDAAMQTKEAS